jgi:hypothetical protein
MGMDDSDLPLAQELDKLNRKRHREPTVVDCRTHRQYFVVERSRETCKYEKFRFHLISDGASYLNGP